MIALSISTLLASIGLLGNSDIYGSHGDYVMVAIAALATVASLVVSNIRYGARSQSMESNYKEMQRLSTRAERALNEKDWAEIKQVDSEYYQLIATSENHSSGDFAKAFPCDKSAQKSERIREDLISLTPWLTLAVPVIVAAPFVLWTVSG